MRNPLRSALRPFLVFGLLAAPSVQAQDELGDALDSTNTVSAGVGLTL